MTKFEEWWRETHDGKNTPKVGACRGWAEEAFRAGQSEMRERAAKECFERADSAAACGMPEQRQEAADCAADIRALPLEET
jgi:hypothetical protein